MISPSLFEGTLYQETSLKRSVADVVLYEGIAGGAGIEGRYEPSQSAQLCGQKRVSSAGVYIGEGKEDVSVRATRCDGT